MPNSAPFPSTEGALDVYFKAAVAYLIAHAVRLLVSTEKQDDLSALLEIWNTVYPLSKNADTRTTTLTKNKDAARDNMKTLLRSVYADIPESVLIMADRTTLNLPEHSKTRIAPAVPDTNPVGRVETQRLQHTIHFTDFDGSPAKPKGVRGCQIWMKIGDVAVDPSELTYVVTCTRSPYIHTFNGADAGKAVYYWLRWENTRGQTGPWSDPVMANIQG